jgi:very-short-patch-repair endonuclease
MTDLLSSDDDNDNEEPEQSPLHFLHIKGQIWKGFPHDILAYQHPNKVIYLDWTTICQWIKVKCQQTTTMFIPNVIIQCDTGQIVTPTSSITTSSQPISMVSIDSFVSEVQKRINQKRKHLQYKQEILRLIGLHHCIQPSIDIEHQCLHGLLYSCPFTIQCNYRLGNYKIDAYIPDLRLAIEIDEHNHKGYNADHEKTREREIRNASIVLLRFNPHQHKNPSETLVAEVWKKTLSPEMKAFVRLIV